MDLTPKTTITMENKKEQEIVEKILSLGGAIECACSEIEIQDIKEEAIELYNDQTTQLREDKKLMGKLLRDRDEQVLKLREENDRLRKIVKKYIEDRKGVAGLTPVGTDMYNDLHEEIKEAEQLLKE